MTACRRGHEFTPENTRIDSRGHRICRTCGRERIAAFRQKRRRAALDLARSITLNQNGTTA